MSERPAYSDEYSLEPTLEASSSDSDPSVLDVLNENIPATDLDARPEVRDELADAKREIGAGAEAMATGLGRIGKALNMNRRDFLRLGAAAFTLFVSTFSRRRGYGGASLPMDETASNDSVTTIVQNSGRGAGISYPSPEDIAAVVSPQDTQTEAESSVVDDNEVLRGAETLRHENRFTVGPIVLEGDVRIVIPSSTTGKASVTHTSELNMTSMGKTFEEQAAFGLEDMTVGEAFADPYTDNAVQRNIGYAVGIRQGTGNERRGKALVSAHSGLGGKLRLEDLPLEHLENEFNRYNRSPYEANGKVIALVQPAREEASVDDPSVKVNVPASIVFLRTVAHKQLSGSGAFANNFKWSDDRRRLLVDITSGEIANVPNITDADLLITTCSGTLREDPETGESHWSNTKLLGLRVSSACTGDDYNDALTFQTRDIKDASLGEYAALMICECLNARYGEALNVQELSNTRHLYSMEYSELVTNLGLPENQKRMILDTTKLFKPYYTNAVRTMSDAQFQAHIESKPVYWGDGIEEFLDKRGGSYGTTPLKVLPDGTVRVAGVAFRSFYFDGTDSKLDFPLVLEEVFQSEQLNLLLREMGGKYSHKLNAYTGYFAETAGYDSPERICKELTVGNLRAFTELIQQEVLSRQMGLNSNVYSIRYQDEEYSPSQTASAYRNLSNLMNDCLNSQEISGFRQDNPNLFADVLLDPKKVRVLNDAFRRKYKSSLIGQKGSDGRTLDDKDIQIWNLFGLHRNKNAYGETDIKPLITTLPAPDYNF